VPMALSATTVIKLSGTRSGVHVERDIPPHRAWSLGKDSLPSNFLTFSFKTSEIACILSGIFVRTFLEDVVMSRSLARRTGRNVMSKYSSSLDAMGGPKVGDLSSRYRSSGSQCTIAPVYYSVV